MEGLGRCLFQALEVLPEGQLSLPLGQYLAERHLCVERPDPFVLVPQLDICELQLSLPFLLFPDHFLPVNLEKRRIGIKHLMNRSRGFLCVTL